nr:helix-turn-helix domain-containing protein [Candidatus Sumerlaeota bacterium]
NLTPSKILGSEPQPVSTRAIPADYREARTQFESEYMRELLEITGGSVTEAARLSGVSRRNLYEKLEKLGLQPDEFKKKGS